MEKVPRGIRREKSSEDMPGSRNLVSTIWAQASPQIGAGGRNQVSGRVKRSLLACHTHCKCSMETTHNSVKIKVGINVLKFVESLIGREVTVDSDDKKKLLLSYPKNICIV